MDDITRKSHYEMPDETPRAVATKTMLPPEYGGPQRDAINSVLDGITQDVSRKIDDLRKQLDDIEQAVLQGAAKSKEALHNQIVVCIRINDEISHMKMVVEEIAAAQPKE